MSNSGPIAGFLGRGRATLALFGSLALAQPTLRSGAGNAPGPPAAPAGSRATSRRRQRAAALAAKANVRCHRSLDQGERHRDKRTDLPHIVSAKESGRLLSVDAAMANHIELHDASAGHGARDAHAR